MSGVRQGNAALPESDPDTLRREIAHYKRVAEQEAHRAGAIMVDLTNAEASMRGLRRQIQALQKELDQARDEDNLNTDAKEVFEHWKTVLRPKAKTFRGKRQKAVQARLAEGYSAAELKTAIDGAKIGAFEKDGRRYDDLELICRDATNVDRFMEYAAAAPKQDDLDPFEQQTTLMEGLRAKFGWRGSPLPHSEETAYPCPRCPPDPAGIYRPLRFPYGCEPVVFCRDCGLTPSELVKILTEAP